MCECRSVKKGPLPFNIDGEDHERFLDYLEKQVCELNEKKENAPKCCFATISFRCNITVQTELSPVSCQSAAAAEKETIQRLGRRREVLRLYLTLDKTKKDCWERMLQRQS